METDRVLCIALVCLASLVVLMAMCTQSLSKVVATYMLGILAICGVLLPDWDFFDRSVSQWCTVLTDPPHPHRPSQSTTPPRFKFYPMRLVVYAAVYGFAFHKWWNFIISS